MNVPHLPGKRLTGKMPGKKKYGLMTPLLGFCMVVALTLLPTPLSRTAAVAAPEKPDLHMALSKDAYWYRPGETVGLQVTLRNETGQDVSGISVRAKVHTACDTRSDLDDCFEGNPVSSYRLSETLGRDLSLSPGNNGFKFDLTVPSRWFSDGVYPLTVEAIDSGEVVVKVVSELILMDPVEGEGSKPLNLSVVFDLSEQPHQGPDGKFSNDELAGECSASGAEPGWYSSLVGAVEKWENLRFTFSLSPIILSEMLEMTDGYVIRERDRERTVKAGSTTASDVAAVVSGFQELALSPHIQFLSTPFAAPNLETLVSLGWAEDARRQIAMGNKTLEEGLESTVDNEYFFPPGLGANSLVVGELGEEAGRFLLLSPQLLARSSQGSRLSTGFTLNSPVEIAGSGGRQVFGFFADSRLEKVIERVGQSGDARAIAECVLSDLTNLYLERPSMTRGCVLLWPDWWRPSARVIEELLKAIEGAPWLKSVKLGEIWAEVPPVEDTVLEIPEPDPVVNGYFTTVGNARNRYSDYSGITLPDNPVLPALERNLFVSESEMWQGGGEARGAEYAEAVIEKVDEELARIEIPSSGTVTLTSENAEVPFSIVNGDSYSIRAVLNLSSNGLSFPEGDSINVVLEPKENLFEVPVKVHKKGKVRLTVRLETGRIVLAEHDIPVRTGQLNTFAIILVGALLGLIGLVWTLKQAARRNAGKHRKQNVSRTESEGNQEEA